MVNLPKIYIICGSLFAFGVIENLFVFYHTKTSYLQKIRSNYTLAFINAISINSMFIFLLTWITTKPVFSGIIPLCIPNPHIQFLISFLLLDFFMYTWHRLMHEVPWGWKFHQVHHSELNLNTSSSFRFHSIEIFTSKILQLGWIWLLGIDLEFYFFYEIIFIVIVLFQHSNIAVPFCLDKIMSYVIVTPNFHRIHHSQNGYEANSNYSSVLSLWDFVFRTFKWHKNPLLIQIGMVEYPQQKNTLQLLKMPFTKKKGR
ncbi:sterol desaturase family protein [Candidatus Uabimicrobium sp. HlEnr_7]|uniref:sterol desaturase family protein n=1 Tax=Candidatus Uabimicrobium helgolandensis TaxID=3095367 RepID=UPI0035576799